MAAQLPKFRGIWVATLTGFNAQTGKADTSSIDAYARHLEDDGAAGVFINGTSAEALSLTTEERILLAEAWKKAVDKNKKLGLIVHVGSTSVETAKHLAAHAESLGVDGISAVPPCYHKPANVDALVRFTKAVAGAAPKTPFILYHIPSFTNVYFPMKEYLTKGKPEIPTLEGVKFTHTDLLDLERCNHHPLGPFSMFSGFDQSLLPNLTIGCVSTIGISYNMLLPRYQRVMDLYAKGDLAAAAKEQQALNEWYEVIDRYGLIAVHKALLSHRGVDLGPVRLPLSDLSPEQKDKLLAELKTLEIFPDLKLKL